MPGIPECGSNGSEQAVGPIEESRVVLDEDNRMACLLQDREQLVGSERPPDLEI